MSCLFSAGITRDCGYNFGGLQKVYLANASEVISVDKDTDNQITGITMSSGATFYEFEFAIMQTQDDLYWYFGELGRGLKASTLNIDSGTADADDATATVALAGGNRGYANSVDESIIAGLL